MVHVDRQNVFLSIQADQQCAQQWTSRQIKGALSGFMEQGASNSFVQITCERIQIETGNVLFQCGQNDLDGMFLDNLEDGAQAFMPGGEGVETAHEAVQIEGASQTHGQGQGIRTTAGFHLIQEPEPLLGKRKWECLWSCFDYQRRFQSGLSLAET